MSEVLTYEQLMAAFQKMRERQEEADRQMEKSRLELDKRFAETALMFKETDRKFAETDRLSKRLSRQLGGMSYRNGAMAETYFYNTFKKMKMFGDEKFDRVRRNISGENRGLCDEYDIVLYNCDSIRIVEVKYGATIDAIAQTLKKATTFREIFPQYKDTAIYLGIASLSFDESIERAILDAGIAVAKQVGDTVVVQDERMKKF